MYNIQHELSRYGDFSVHLVDSPITISRIEFPRHYCVINSDTGNVEYKTAALADAVQFAHNSNAALEFYSMESSATEADIMRLVTDEEEVKH